MDIKKWEQQFDKIFIDENIWKSEDGYTANVGVGNIKDFIRQIIKFYECGHESGKEGICDHCHYFVERCTGRESEIEL